MIDPDDSTRFDGIEQQTPPSASEQPPVRWVVLVTYGGNEWHLFRYNGQCGTRSAAEPQAVIDSKKYGLTTAAFAILPAARYDQLIAAEQERDALRAWIDKMKFGGAQR